MNKLIIIAGLTCTGKSELAIEIAKQYNGEIISADSVQIYKGLDIGSAKVDKATQKEIKHHLIDIRNFNENYNVNEFVADCKQKIADILSRGKLPIIVGGTGLYIKALLSNYNFGDSETDTSLREHYSNLAAKQGNEHVWQILNSLNPEKAKTVHPNNLKRVIRYIEIESLGASKQTTSSALEGLNYLAVGIVDDRAAVYERINSRVDKMLASGLEKEVKGLIEKGARREMQSMNSIGYKEWFDYFDKKHDPNRTIELIKQHTRNYCKRQLTFLKTIEGLELCTKQDAETKIKEFLND